MKYALMLAVSFAAGFAQEPFPGSASIDDAIEEAIRENQMPGAVALVGQKQVILHRKAYGLRSLTPSREPMTLDTIFDAASLTKVVATSSAVMRLFEQGRIRLNDKVTDYLPEFQGGKSDITVRLLLTHFSGFRPDVDLEPVWSGYERGIKLALVDKSVAAPGEKFIYSDINFLLLGAIVEKRSGRPFADYVREEIFLPLGMKETTFRPAAQLHSRIAPTEKLPGDAEPLRGVVHDPTARYMGGVAGHAGMFTSAADLSRFARMIAARGVLDGKRHFSAAAVEKFTTPQTPPDQPILRGLGWDIDSPFSANRGDLFPIGSHGHTGFTGTSLWIDPVSESYVILLANSVHPVRKPPITSLRGRVATVVASALGRTSPDVTLTGYNETLAGAGVRRVVERNAEVLTGIDVLAEQKFARLNGKRIGLITNHTGLDRSGRRNVDVMTQAAVRVEAMYAPEHGFTGSEDHENIGHSRDAATGVRIWSLYEGEKRRPTAEMLRNVDVIVFDIQDVGARFYTYLCTLQYAMEEAAKRNLALMVLDRPNPITGVKVEGPLLDRDLESFVGCHPIPVRHGMTIGEIARMMNEERGIKARLEVVPLKNWQRGDWFDSAGLAWVDPSPNIRSLNAALLFPGVAMLEYSTDYSVGRGTDAPFEQIGAPWIKGPELASYLNRRQIPGVRAYPTRFRPNSSRLSGTVVEGVRFVITQREAFNSVRLGVEIGAALEKLYPGKIPWEKNEKLIGTRTLAAAVRAGDDPRAITAKWDDDLRAFLARRNRFLMYR